MTRPRSLRKWLGKCGVVGIVSAVMVMIPLLEHPVAAQQSWSPPTQQWSPAPPGAPYYAPAPVDTSRAVMEATQDAQADNNAVLWFFAGCLLELIGVLIAALVDPTPPPARLMGKSPEYVAVYVQTYKSEGRSAQLKSALWGLGTVIVLSVILIIVLVRSASATEGPEFIIMRQ
jgi:hypothetical protein